MTALLEASETRHTDVHWEDMHVESAEQPARWVENKDDGEATRTGSHRFDVVEWQGVFMRTFKRDPRRALAQLVQPLFRAASTHGAGTREAPERLHAIRLIFDEMIDATPYGRRLGAQAILSFAEPHEVIVVAISEFRLYGHEDRLMFAAHLLESMGPESWSALGVLAKSNSAECEYFVPVIARLAGVPIADRLVVLADMGRNLDLSTRVRVLEALDDFPAPDTISVLKVLASTGPASDDVRASATERLRAF